MHEVADLYIGQGLKKASAVPDETEFLEIGIIPFLEALQMVLSGEIRDSMSVIAILIAARKYEL